MHNIKKTFFHSLISITINKLNYITRDYNLISINSQRVS